MYAVTQKIITVDLSERSVKIGQLDASIYRSFFSGSGIGIYKLHEEKNYAVDPLSPENTLYILPGLLTGLPIYTACKTSICAKSPLTGIWGESTFGGHWGSELKRAGYDGLSIRGASNTPVYLLVTPHSIVIKDAGEVWGCNTYETDQMIRQGEQSKAKVICIGRAGEKQSKMAAIMAEGIIARAAGRTGLGAIMGAKKLKAVAVIKGNERIKICDKANLRKSVKSFLPTLKKYTGVRTKLGTAYAVKAKEAIGGLPLKNFSHGIEWETGANRISGETIRETIWTKDYGCFQCPIMCGKKVKVSSGPYANLVGHSPEYETLAGFGSNLLNDDLESIVNINHLCNDYGIDTISTAATISFAFEAYEKGLITQKDTDGVALVWGAKSTIFELVRKIGEREGFGAILADGSAIAAERLGHGCCELVATAKNLEPSITMPTSTVSLGLSWATSNRGACHLEGLSHAVEGGVPFPEMGYPGMVDGYTSEGKGRLVRIMQDYMAVFNALGLCKFMFGARLSLNTTSEWVRLTTGWDMDEKELLNVGTRIYNLKRVYNNHAGVTRNDDTLTQRLMETLQEDGTGEDKEKFLKIMLKDYYMERGWNKDGFPQKDTLKKLGLDL